MVALYQAEQKLDEAISMSLMAMLFYMFIGVNMLFYHGLTTLIAFLAVIKRISSIFNLDEYHSDRTIPADKTQTSISLSECSFTWGFRVAEKKEEEKAVDKGADEAVSKDATKDKGDGKKEAKAPQDKFKT